MQTRRNFIQKSLLASGGTFFIAHGLFAKSKKDDVIIGEGNFRYRWIKGWGDLDPATTPVKDCHEMQQDKKGRIFLLGNEIKNNIIIYNTSGKFLGSWGHEFPGGHGLTLWNANGEEFLFITDPEKNEVYKTTLDGKILMTLSFPADIKEYTKKEEFKPTETAIMPNGDIYVADGYGKDFIIRYNAKGELLGYFGGRGAEEKNLDNAHGVAIDWRIKDKPELLVTSRKQNCFKRFTLEGQHLKTISLPGAFNCRPVVHGQNLFFAVLISKLPWDSQTGYISILDDKDQVVCNPNGSSPKYLDGKLQNMEQTTKVFKHPHDVLIDKDENLYVAQWNSGKVYPMKFERI